MSDKPTGQWKCLVCGKTWDGSKLFRDVQRIAPVWTCADLFCGGACVPAKAEASAPK